MIYKTNKEHNDFVDYRFCEALIPGFVRLAVNICMADDPLSNKRQKHRKAPTAVAELDLPS